MAERHEGSRISAVEREGTRAPRDPAIEDLARHGRTDFPAVLRRHLDSPLAWAILAEGSLLARTPQADVAAYSHAMTGRALGMEALRAAGWTAGDRIVWGDEVNSGLLRCLAALAEASTRLGDVDRAERVRAERRSLAPDLAD